MKCPRCETTTLDEKDREGIVIDVCGQCRGLWLDRGELEKLLAGVPERSRPDRGRRDDDDDDDDDDDRRARGSQGRRSWWEIFD